MLSRARSRFSSPAWLLFLLLGLAVAGCPSGDDDTTTSPTPSGDDDTTIPETPTPTAIPDQDGDGIPDADDNCPDVANPDQADTDQDGLGDACSSERCDGLDNNGDGVVDENFPDDDSDGVANCVDDCKNDPDNDADQDGLCGDEDNCPDTANEDQTDSDSDGMGDACDPCPTDNPNDTDTDDVCDSTDNCPETANTDQADTDGDGMGDACDDFPNDPDNDADADGVGADTDNCPNDSNPDQADADADGIGDTCDTCPYDSDNDADADGFCAGDDNCPNDSNPDQTDSDFDGLGDACDLCPQDGLNDYDGDGLCADVDTCPMDPDNDADSDGVCGNTDNCPNESNPDQADADYDGNGDACDPCPNDAQDDIDGDGVCGDIDNCPDVANEDQADSDGDGKGDACDPCDNNTDPDTDGDGTCDKIDNCPDVVNVNQMDRDQDGAGDACDTCPDDNPDDPDGDGECGEPAPTPSPDATFYIFGTNPDNGYESVSLTPNGRIYFSETYTGDPNMVHVTIVSQYGDVDEMVVTLTGNYAKFYPTLKADSDYCLFAEVEYQESVPGRWPLEHTACFTTRKPCGVPINVGGGTEVKNLGNSPVVVSILNDLIQYYGNDYPVVFLLENVDPTDTFPLENIDAVLGAFEEQPDGSNTLRKDGYTSTFEGCSTDDSGQLTCNGESAVFPLYVGDFGVNLYVSNAQIAGKLLSDGAIESMQIFNLTGVVTEDAISRIEEETGVSGVSDAVSLNVDQDGDGVNDAATFWVQTHPQPMELAGASCED